MILSTQLEPPSKASAKKSEAQHLLKLHQRCLQAVLLQTISEVMGLIQNPSTNLRRAYIKDRTTDLHSKRIILKGANLVFKCVFQLWKCLHSLQTRKQGLVPQGTRCFQFPIKSTGIAHTLLCEIQT